ncbi:MAG: M20/M25/M40 family metallo-hydrolase [Bacteroidales bacterium]|nr:M20/M25/M40 family metallo-hydrolase [Bacteroidales bacterium]
MLCAHIDTVAPCEGYVFDPYMPDYEIAAKVIGDALGRPCRPDEIVAGLGSNDDGASAVAMIAAYRYFCSIRPFRGRGHGMHDNPSHSVVVGPSPCGQGGSTVMHTMTPAPECNLTLVLTCEEERSGKDGMTLLWPMRLNRIDYAIVGEPTGMKAATSERGLLVIDATAHGISGHAARNEGKNALYIALEDIEKIRNHKFSKVSPRMGEVNINVTQINAGTAHNVIPDRCDFVIDIRPTEQYTNEEILQELQGICQSELRPRNLSNRSSATAEGSPLQKAAQSLGIGTFSSPTTSDWMRITCDAVKMGPGDSSRSHRRNEFILVSEIRNAIEAYIDYINNIYIMP